MPVGINPGVYVEVVPQEFIPDFSSGSTNSLFVGFSKKGVDNRLLKLTGPGDLLKKLGTPRKKLYGQALNNAYLHSIVSGNTKFLRVLPTLEDAQYDLPSTVYPTPATFANINYVVLESKSPYAKYLFIPISFVPQYWKTGISGMDDQFNEKGIPQSVVNLFIQEGENSAEIANNHGAQMLVTRSITLSIYYNEEPNDITLAGVHENSIPLTIRYADLYPCMIKLLSNIRDDNNIVNSTFESYVSDFFKDLKINLSTNIFNIPTSSQNITVTADMIAHGFELTDTTLSGALTVIAIKNYGQTDVRYHYLAVDNDNKISLAGFQEDDQLFLVPFQHTLTPIAPGTNATIPTTSHYIVGTNKNIDFIKYSYRRRIDGANTTITNITNATIYLLHKNDIPIAEAVIPVDENEFGSDTVTVTHKFVVDSLASQYGSYLVAMRNGHILHPSTYTFTKGVFSATIQKTTPGVEYIKLVYLQAYDADATVSATPILSFLAKGRGGYYNKMAIAITPKFSLNNAGKLIPNARHYLLSTALFDAQVGDYLGIGSSMDISCRKDDTDEVGISIFVEDVVNLFSDSLQVLSNRLFTDKLVRQDPIDNRFSNLYEQLFAYAVALTPRLAPLIGGSDGCLRDVETGMINWTIATSLLVIAMRGGYDLQIFNTDDEDIDIVFDSDYPTVVKKEMIRFAELRKDCIAILDTPKRPNLETALQWFDNTLKTTTYYAAIYLPHGKTYDPFEKGYVWLSPSYFLSYLFPYVDRSYGFYYPVANYERGQIKETIERFAYNIPLTEYSALQESTYVRGINLIGRKRGRNIVWGNYSLTNRNTALQSLHVVRLIAKLTREVRKLDKHIWDLMQPSIFSSIKSQVTGLLNEYLGTAIENFNVSVYASEYDRQRRLVNVSIIIKPFLEIRRIKVTFVVT